ncbi:MAG TPA: histidine kinase dimerization/phospho-acceptor domain-containing protein, partial [Ktedonobacterales bacterium]|nr:histidine kinase dimerization/phospho-acceptor domain-containing protein [Ktedonobacterales bacterium]
MPLPPRGPRWRGRAGFAFWHPLGGIALRVRAIVSDPFRADPAGALSRSPTARLRDRRIALNRLILLCVILVAGLGIVPAVAAAHAPLLLAAVAADLLLSVVCLVVNQGGYPTPAALLFIVGAVAIGVAYTRLSPTALPRTQGIVLLIYATMSLLILLAGSVLPPVFVWLVAGLVIAVTLTGLLGRPAVVDQGGGPGPGPGPGPVPAPGLTAVVLVVALQAMTAVMSWVAAQSAAASAATANAALDQARELTALKDQFLIDANHELRTPIMAWYGNTELLANFSSRATAEQRERMLERALASGDAVLQLLNAVLDAGA